MPDALFFLGIYGLIAASSINKLMWHGKWRKQEMLWVAHSLSIAMLTCPIGWYASKLGVGHVLTWVCPFVILCAWASWVILDHVPRLEWWWVERSWLCGWDAWHVLSFMSDTPAQIVAAGMLVAWLVVSGEYVAAVGVGLGFLAEGGMLKFVAWQHPALRLERWND